MASSTNRIRNVQVVIGRRPSDVHDDESASSHTNLHSSTNIQQLFANGSNSDMERDARHAAVASSDERSSQDGSEKRGRSTMRKRSKSAKDRVRNHDESKGKSRGRSRSRRASRTRSESNSRGRSRTRVNDDDGKRNANDNPRRRNRRNIGHGFDSKEPAFLKTLDRMMGYLGVEVGDDIDDPDESIISEHTNQQPGMMHNTRRYIGSILTEGGSSDDAPKGGIEAFFMENFMCGMSACAKSNQSYSSDEESEAKGNKRSRVRASRRKKRNSSKPKTGSSTREKASRKDRASREVQRGTDESDSKSQTGHEDRAEEFVEPYQQRRAKEFTSRYLSDARADGDESCASASHIIEGRNVVAEHEGDFVSPADVATLGSDSSAHHANSNVSNSNVSNSNVSNSNVSNSNVAKNEQDTLEATTENDPVSADGGSATIAYVLISAKAKRGKTSHKAKSSRRTKSNAFQLAMRNMNQHKKHRKRIEQLKLAASESYAKMHGGMSATVRIVEVKEWVDSKSRQKYVGSAVVHRSKLPERLVTSTGGVSADGDHGDHEGHEGHREAELQSVAQDHEQVPHIVNETAASTAELESKENISPADIEVAASSLDPSSGSKEETDVSYGVAVMTTEEGPASRAAADGHDAGSEDSEGLQSQTLKEAESTDTSTDMDSPIPTVDTQSTMMSTPPRPTKRMTTKPASDTITITEKEPALETNHSYLTDTSPETSFEEFHQHLQLQPSSSGEEDANASTPMLDLPSKRQSTRSVELAKRISKHGDRKVARSKQVRGFIAGLSPFKKLGSPSRPPSSRKGAPVKQKQRNQRSKTTYKNLNIDGATDSTPHSSGVEPSPDETAKNLRKTIGRLVLARPHAKNESIDSNDDNASAPAPQAPSTPGSPKLVRTAGKDQSTSAPTPAPRTPSDSGMEAQTRVRQSRAVPAKRDIRTAPKMVAHQPINDGNQNESSPALSPYHAASVRHPNHRSNSSSPKFNKTAGMGDFADWSVIAETEETVETPNQKNEESFESYIQHQQPTKTQASSPKHVADFADWAEAM